MPQLSPSRQDWNLILQRLIRLGFLHAKSRFGASLPLSLHLHPSPDLRQPTLPGKSHGGHSGGSSSRLTVKQGHVHNTPEHRAGSSVTRSSISRDTWAARTSPEQRRCLQILRTRESNHRHLRSERACKVKKALADTSSKSSLLPHLKPPARRAFFSVYPQGSTPRQLRSLSPESLRTRTLPIRFGNDKQPCHSTVRSQRKPPLPYFRES